MTKRSRDWEQIASVFPSPKGSRPARSLTYRCRGQVYRAVIGHRRAPCEAVRAAGGGTASEGAGPGSGNTVISIVATRAAVEIWSREPPLGWPNPSLVAHEAVMSIEYLDRPDTAGR